ncbi:SIS domain-containing protein [Paenibacillus larvae]|nr:SIS domain-containing protein [Paenibacillus larvae]MDT2241979.1 SIS domain-containing protein [Paenibacillus larvae]
MIQTIQMLDTRQLEKAIQEIYKASKVYVFARGFSEFIGTELTVKLQLMGKNCEMHNDPNIIRVISRKLVKDDVVLFVSLNGETGELVEACKNFKIKEIPTITLTTRIDSSLARLSDIVIVGYKGEQSFFPEYEVRSRLPLHVLSRVLLDAYVIRLNNH